MLLCSILELGLEFLLDLLAHGLQGIVAFTYALGELFVQFREYALFDIAHRNRHLHRFARHFLDRKIVGNRQLEFFERIQLNAHKRLGESGEWAICILNQQIHGVRLVENVLPVHSASSRHGNHVVHRYRTLNRLP